MKLDTFEFVQIAHYKETILRLTSMAAILVLSLFLVTTLACDSSSTSKKTGTLSYEIINTSTVMFMEDDHVVEDTPGHWRVVTYPEARVEIKNTGNIAGLFSVYFFFSEEFCGRDLIYLKPGETGIASYATGIPHAYFADDKSFHQETANWTYEVTPVTYDTN